MEPKISSGEMVNLQDLNTVVQEQTSKSYQNKLPFSAELTYQCCSTLR